MIDLNSFVYLELLQPTLSPTKYPKQEHCTPSPYVPPYKLRAQSHPLTNPGGDGTADQSPAARSGFSNLALNFQTPSSSIPPASPRPSSSLSRPQFPPGQCSSSVRLSPLRGAPLRGLLLRARFLRPLPDVREPSCFFFRCSDWIGVVVGGGCGGFLWRYRGQFVSVEGWFLWTIGYWVIGVAC